LPLFCFICRSCGRRKRSAMPGTKLAIRCVAPQTICDERQVASDVLCSGSRQKTSSGEVDRGWRGPFRGNSAPVPLRYCCFFSFTEICFMIIECVASGSFLCVGSRKGCSHQGVIRRRISVILLLFLLLMHLSSAETFNCRCSFKNIHVSAWSALECKSIK
jgi:hypothetical protein